MLNATTLNGANGADAVSGPGPLVADLVGFPNLPKVRRRPRRPPVRASFSTIRWTACLAPGDRSGLVRLDLHLHHRYQPTERWRAIIFSSAFRNSISASTTPTRTTRTRPDRSVKQRCSTRRATPTSWPASPAPALRRSMGNLEEATAPSANLFFLNSSGVMFGGNSSLNLNGALTISTANAIQLSTFPFGELRGLSSARTIPLADAGSRATPSLFTGPVAAFGFRHHGTHAGRLRDGALSPMTAPRTARFKLSPATSPSAMESLVNASRHFAL